jgi:hypothetical protein
MTDPQTVPDTGIPQPVDPEDTKIITLARSALARTQAPQGACLRDTDGRTYAGATVQLDHLRLSAIQVVVAMAVSSGAQGVEAVAVSGQHGPDADDLAAVGDLPGSGVAVWVTDPRGAVLDRISLS